MTRRWTGLAAVVGAFALAGCLQSLPTTQPAAEAPPTAAGAGDAEPATRAETSAPAPGSSAPLDITSSAGDAASARPQQALPPWARTPGGGAAWDDGAPWATAADAPSSTLAIESFESLALLSLDPDLPEADDPIAEPEPADLYEAAGGPADRSRAALAEARLPAEQVGFLVIDAATGAVVAQHNADKPFIPASVAKVPSALAALDVLGGDFRFRTVLAVTGAVADGVLDGDVYLWGGGDPMLEPPDLVGFVRALADAGVEEVAGRLVFDDSYLTTTEAIDPAQPDDAGYNPSVGALSLGFNRVRLKWRPAKNGDFVARAVAHSHKLQVPVQTVRLSRAGADASRYMRLEHDETAEGEAWVVGPYGRGGGVRWLPVRHPGRHTATVLRALAAKSGIDLPEPEAGILPHEARVIHRHMSEPLAKILPRVLRYSNNVATELIGLTATREMVGEARSLKGSGAALGKWLRARMPSVSWDGFSLANHSGLSSDSRMTPAQATAVLEYALASPPGGTEIAPLLPREYDTRWVQDRAGIPRGTAIRAKTGTMYYGRGLSGRIETADGRPLLFAFFASDPAARAAYDADPDQLSPANTRKARSWLKKAKTLEQQLMAIWSSPLPETQEVAPKTRPAPKPTAALAVPATARVN